MKRLLLMAVAAVALLGVLVAPAYAGNTAQVWHPPYNVPVLVPPFGPGVWVELTDPSVPPTMDWLVQASDPLAVPDPANGIYAYRAFPAGRDAFVTAGWFGSTYGQVQNVSRSLATVVDITGPDGFHQHWDPADTASYWTGPHQWDQWWIDWFGGATAPPLFNARAQAGVYLNHLWLPVGPFPTAGTYHLYMSQTQARPIVELVEGFTEVRPYHYTPADLNWEMEFDFTVQ